MRIALTQMDQKWENKKGAAGFPATPKINFRRPVSRVLLASSRRPALIYLVLRLL